jgi:hypothetical protein
MAEALETSLRNGNRPLVTVTKEREQVKMFMETAISWGKLNFYAENGRPKKREQFLKEPAMENQLLNGKNKDRD